MSRRTTWLVAALVVAAGGTARAEGHPDAEWRPAAASHFRKGRRATIDRVVLHTVEGSYEGAIGTFQKGARKVSAHYVVGKAGALARCVEDEDTAWHCGSWNGRSIGIEHEGYAGKASTWTPELLRTSARLTRWLCDRYGIPIDREHIVGHVEAPGATHTDPGPHFDWDAYLELVRSDGGPGGLPTRRDDGLPPPEKKEEKDRAPEEEAPPEAPSPEDAVLEPLKPRAGRARRQAGLAGRLTGEAGRAAPSTPKGP